MSMVQSPIRITGHNFACSSVQMSKTIGTLEKEMLMWKGRYEKCNKSLLEMAQEVCNSVAIATAVRYRGDT